MNARPYRGTDREGMPCARPTPPIAAVMTVDEAAKFLRVGINQLYEAIGRGHVPHRRVGKTIRLGREALVLWLQERPETGQRRH